MSAKVFALVFSAIFLGGAVYAFPMIPDSNITLLEQTARNQASFRLPNNTIPESYDVTLEPLFPLEENDFVFLGSVNIVIEVLEATNLITLHAFQLDIENVTVRVLNEVEPLEISEVRLDEREDYHFLYIELVDELPAGEVLELSVEYVGHLNGQNRGFYRASYVEDGVTKWFGTTQFESTSARIAFPCYDEPALKANFTIHIIREEPYKSISNMELDHSEDLGDGVFIDHYKESVKMPTYLVAFIVSEMRSTDVRENQAVYAARDLIADGWADYALEAGIGILSAMEEFTGIPYSLNKMDQAAIPNNWFSAGAMENWGLVTYREQYLLFKEGITTTSTKQSIASIIAHEYGHQWFGNLVSPLWWSYIWLNEGFATYFEHYATDVFDPSIRMMDQFTNLINYYAMESDGTRSSRPMSYYAETPSQISNLFDRIAYEKSGAVIRMMEHIVTTEVFKQGLNIYLHAREYDAAEPADLWQGIQDAVDASNIELGVSVAEVMETWNNQAGYPVVNVERVDGKISLSQSRFLLNEASHNLNTIWTIPINYATASNPDFANTRPTHWFTTRNEATEIEIGEDEWIILNKQSTGYYRVNYDEHSWHLIIDLLDSDDYDTVHLLSRNQLFEDALNLARSRRLDYRIAFSVLATLKRETDYVPLHTLFRGLTFLHRYLINTDEYYEIVQKFIWETLQAAFDDLDATSNSGAHTDRLNWINVLTWLCRYEHEGCLEATHTKLNALERPHPDEQAVVYCGGLMTEENIEAKWNWLYQRYTGNDAESTEKTRILTALGCARSTAHLTRFLDAAIGVNTEFPISANDRTAAFSAVYSSSKYGLDFAFNYILTRFDDIYDGSLTSNQISTIVNGVADRLTTAEQRDQLQELHDSLEGDRKVQTVGIFESARSRVNSNIEWFAQPGEEIRSWLNEYNSAFAVAVSLPLLVIALFSHLVFFN